MHSTNYRRTLITVASDTRAQKGTEPPHGKGSIAERQYVLLHNREYQLTSDELIFTVYADRQGIPAQERGRALKEYYAQGRACLRSSPLAKSYGWGFHFDDDGLLALVPVDSQRYAELIEDDSVTKLPAMRSKRA
ncbi:hypothetical protein FCK90_07545 [Kocuria coralli]|uniref:Uncharacterized protein n=1 Tax=Kocuria coralli TaxID=1461025 RepID=A0A5J5L026_9MICC|nr:DUF6157 family protein [Kocuria coralli]KAA9394321.1 hypothetical protein FCK90_07545 [Kocuria coralli]